jgi:hypothetical protein
MLYQWLGCAARGFAVVHSTGNAEASKPLLSLCLRALRDASKDLHHHLLDVSDCARVDWARDRHHSAPRQATWPQGLVKITEAVIFPNVTPPCASPESVAKRFNDLRVAMHTVCLHFSESSCNK